MDLVTLLEKIEPVDVFHEDSTDAHALPSGTVMTNYERLFSICDRILALQKGPLPKLAPLTCEIVEGASWSTFCIPPILTRILAQRQRAAIGRAAYLQELINLSGPGSTTEIFTLNFDLCVEDMCDSAGITWMSGFHPRYGTWDRTAHDNNTFVRLHKLHGSLSWFKYGTAITELRGPSEACAAILNKQYNPELTLGPHKPYLDGVTIASIDRFICTLRAIKILVVVGYGYGDRYVNELIDRARHDTLFVVDVRPPDPHRPIGRKLWDAEVPEPASFALQTGTLRRQVAAARARIL